MEEMKSQETEDSPDRDEYLEDLEEETTRRANKRGRKRASLPMIVDGASVKLLARLADERLRGER